MDQTHNIYNMYVLINKSNSEDVKIYLHKITLANDIDIHVNSINKDIKHIKNYIIIKTDVIKGNKRCNIKR